ncbi:MAG: sodium:solute symporter family protein [Xanthomonadales bacterium]|nr:sodium:solute symporter family protein [Xanthomonadales bacterium]ODU93975.1 MAG: sodium:solute symporter [Rhodanobacter sp. SCN 66-43]OJY82682.1 MAG: sodium:solute symporter [Xanthomonadales bacterium 66-474]
MSLPSGSAVRFDGTALGVFAFFFVLITVLGFIAARWRRGDLSQLHEWGLGGRRFGAFVTWFLLGGDLYTAYTLIAVPALVYAVGAYGFFAMPYTVFVYPIVFLTMPRLWNVCRKHGWITSADFVEGRYGSRGLALAVAITGVLATMPYIALQLVGLEKVFEAMGLGALGIGKETPLVIAFVILALYTYSSGLRAPALIAFVKDAMLYITVIAAVVIIPIKLGGYGAVFDAAGKAFAAKGGDTGVLLKPDQYWSFATLALGSAFALFLYPHATTATLSADGPQTIRRNAVWLPAYSIMLGLVALLGYMALAAHVDVKDGSMAVPALINASFPPWFAGFCFAAIALGALVPAAIMSIGAANLFTRNIWRAYVNANLSNAQESRIAKNVSLLVKFGALLAVLYLPTKFAIDLQLLGGIWMLQIFPAVIAGLFTRWLRASALMAGWIAGMVLGSALAWHQGLKPVITFAFGDAHYGIYIGLLALVVNFVVAILATPVAARLKREAPVDRTQKIDFEDVVPD